MIKTEERIATKQNRVLPCPEYDSDCQDVENPFNCFLGITEHPGLSLGMASGSCAELKRRYEEVSG